MDRRTVASLIISGADRIQAGKIGAVVKKSGDGNRGLCRVKAQK